MNDTLQLFGDLEIIVTDSNGNIKSRNFEKNIIPLWVKSTLHLGC